MFTSRSRPRSITPSPPEPAGWLAPITFIASTSVPFALLIAAAATGRSTSPVTWYLARTSGLMLYLVLWFSVVLGLGLTTGQLDRVLRRGTIYSLHRFATALGYGLVTLHLLTLFIDAAMPFSLVDLVVPFAAEWRQPWTGMGVVAAYLLVFVGATSVAVRRMPFRWWRRSHWLAFPLYAMALGHGVGSGTDAASVWVQMMYVATTTVVVWLAAYRILRGRARMSTREVATALVRDRLATRHASFHG